MPSKNKKPQVSDLSALLKGLSVSVADLRRNFAPDERRK